MSTRGSRGSPRACSGAMYSGVPHTRPATVSVPVSLPGSWILAMPKSRTLTTSGEVRVEDLDAHRLAERRVLGEVDAPHRALSERLLDDELLGEALTDVGIFRQPADLDERRPAVLAEPRVGRVVGMTGRAGLHVD